MMFLKKKKSKDHFLGLIMVAIIVIAYPSADFAITVQPDQGVDFGQVDFLFSEVTEVDSTWGQVSANSEILFDSTNIASGYLNIYTDTGWVVQNLPVDLSDGHNLITTYFNLGLAITPQDINQLSAYIEFTLEPKILFTDGLRSNFSVEPVQWNAEGVGEGSMSSVSKEGPVVNLSFIPFGETFKVTQPNAVNVQTAKNQCFPMSIANSLQYLEDRFGLNVPHDHKPGLKGDNTLVGQLDTKANRYAPARNEGNGVWFQPMLRGKFSYLNENGLKNKLIHKHQGRGYGDPEKDQALKDGDFKHMGSTSKDKGAIVTWEWICDEIKHGEDVELVFSYEYEDDEGKKRMGGHAVRVFECGKILGIPWIGYLHDRLQTNLDPNDNQGLENVRVLVGDIDNDGILNLGTKSREIRFALSESIKESTLVTLISFSAGWRDRKIFIEWESAIETDNAGFHLWRATGEGWKNGDYSTVVRLNDQLIPAQGDGASYSHIDFDVEPGITYYYALEDVDLFGISTIHWDFIDSVTVR